ncbi:hypothetical protein [Psychrobium sp. 1_MG-2023]|uniref:hypothetical protein n=1 Tax=Psychrobium sp. 1_MG-2023 TaxID=3062624 RepID=UPI000C3387C1|nr:hypothetical protein [Psychrobium sp. 1_MG-2023]MDP2562505.1 hypothetical protein [Psychrobium sp. 1_MG-2023]PKF58003.1 hypothetical protein CW748_05655 [Alteromonadales bacterium alter-6D02]
MADVHEYVKYLSMRTSNKFLIIVTIIVSFASNANESRCVEKMINNYNEYAHVMSNLNAGGNYFKAAQLRDLNTLWKHAEQSTFYSNDRADVVTLP